MDLKATYVLCIHTDCTKKCLATCLHCQPKEYELKYNNKGKQPDVVNMML